MATTFKRYKWTHHDITTMAEHGVDWDAYPTDWAELAKSAGMDPNDDELGVGTLTEPWNGHPEGALIVSGLSVEGHPFVVSNEAQA